MKKILSALIAGAMCMSSVVFAAPTTEEDVAGYLTMSIEASTLGLGFIEEPTKVPFYEGENVAEVFARFLEENDRDFKYTGEIESSFYLSQLQTDWTDEEINEKMEIPGCIYGQYGKTKDDYIAMGANGNGTLGEFCYSQDSGWMIASADCKGLTTMGVSNVDAVDGDTIRWQFSLEGYGADLGYPNDWGSSPAYLQSDKDALYALIGAINADPEAKAIYDEYVATNPKFLPMVVNSLDIEQKNINNFVEMLYEMTEVGYEYIAEADGEKVVVPTLKEEPTTPAPNPTNQAALDRMEEALDYIYSVVPEPALGTNGGEWAIIALGRAGYDVSDTYYDDYVARLAQTMIDCDGVLHSRKKTENSRVIMGLSAIGVKPFDIGGYDVTADLSSYKDVIWQGINGPDFALIAMDSNNYEFAKNDGADDQNSRRKMIEFIITKEISGGGFALSGTNPDADMTSMTLQALTSYVNGNEMLKAEFGSDEAGYNDMIAKVKDIVDRGIAVLSRLQQADGDFISWGSVNVESTAQALVALTGLGIDPMNDERFITETGKNLLDGILKYSDSTGGFKHTITGSVNQMATEQATYGLVAYERFINGKSRLYDMTENFEDEGTTTPPEEQKAPITISTPDSVVGEAGTEFNVVVTANEWVSDSLKMIDGIYNIPEGFEVVNVTMGSSVTGGSLRYHLDNGSLRFAYMSDTYGDVSLNTETFPVELMTITLALKQDVTEETTVEISADSINVKTASDNNTALDVSEAKDDVTVTVPIPDPVASGRVLYVGDDSDLISSDKQAVAVEILNLQDTSKVMFGNVEMMYSEEMTAKKGVDTYVAIVDANVTVADLNDMDSYTITTETPENITFADVNEDEVVNAQDALDTLSFWLRKTEVENNKQILTANVNADSAITTFDVLAIMENVVNARELDIISK